MKLTMHWTTLAALVALTNASFAQTTGGSNGTAQGHIKTADQTNGFQGQLDNNDQFAARLKGIGVDEEGIAQGIMSATNDDDGGTDCGAIWLLTKDSTGQVIDQKKISALAGGFTGQLDPGDNFGSGLAHLGDLDGDGVDDLAIGADGDDDGGANAGAVWILFMNDDGTVKTHQKISATSGGFGGVLEAGDELGNAATSLGDLNGDGITDLAVGCWQDDDGLPNAGAVWVLFLDSDGTVKSEQKISALSGGFSGTLSQGDLFGSRLDRIGDLDGDGIVDLAVGAWHDDEGGTNRGALWILFLDNNGTVQAHQKINDQHGGWSLGLADWDEFGTPAGMGDLNLDGVCDLVVAARGDEQDSFDEGALYVLFLNPDGTVLEGHKLDQRSGGFHAELAAGDKFGNAVSCAGDLDGNGVADLLVGAPLDDTGGNQRGAFWTIYLYNQGPGHLNYGGLQPVPEADTQLFRVPDSNQMMVRNSGLEGTDIGFSVPLGLAQSPALGFALLDPALHDPDAVVQVEWKGKVNGLLGQRIAEATESIVPLGIALQLELLAHGGATNTVSLYQGPTLVAQADLFHSYEQVILEVDIPCDAGYWCGTVDEFCVAAVPGPECWAFGPRTASAWTVNLRGSVYDDITMIRWVPSTPSLAEGMDEVSVTIQNLDAYAIDALGINYALAINDDNGTDSDGDGDRKDSLYYLGDPVPGIDISLEIDHPEEVRVKNLGSSGENGVRVHMADADSLNMEFSPIDLTADDSQLTLTAHGSPDKTNVWIMGWAVLGDDGSDLDLRADLTGLGASRVRLEMFSSGQLTGSTTVDGGASVGSTSEFAKVSGAGFLDSKYGDPGLFLGFDSPIVFFASDGTSMTGDELHIRADHPTIAADPLLLFDIQAANVDSIEIIGGKVNPTHPVLSAEEIRQGQPATFTVSAAKPNSLLILAYSRNGFGPTNLNTAWGVLTLNLGTPFHEFARVLAQPDGKATVTLGIPPQAAGWEVYCGGVEIANGECRLTNFLHRVIQ